jgi:hypothetical protein
VADLEDLNTIANDGQFQNRCLAALKAAAVDVLAEDPSTQYHTQRAAYANQVISEQVNGEEVASVVLTNSTIAAEVTVASLPGANSTVPDSDIEFAVSSIFNDLAGV